MEPITTFTATCVALPIENIDTDQIIPARYLKTTDKAGLGEALFADWRYDSQGRPNPDFPLNRPDARGAQILIAGHNFGCGSSREHAPWALQGYGFKAVISTYFADIFRNNALKVGLLPIVVDRDTHTRLLRLVEDDPTTRLTVDLATQTLQMPDGATVTFPIDPFARYCLLNGVDQLGFLLSLEDEIAAYEARHPARVNTLAALG
ncbi:3-isopropylmalate dehydratase small subunit [Kallotenue papyrolyticum]|uniref:3-isopropylmalate dehydratase small subunit n=1 Tax=Kallotenue papyrolyticum TaxID=1325125 RepID=UPI0004785B4A|nr:3-isopropylmalate dehydratase small subunit [Kallotenue papyrolyticum]